MTNKKARQQKSDKKRPDMDNKSIPPSQKDEKKGINPEVTKKLNELQNRPPRWKGEFKINETGGIKSKSLNNVVLILEHDPKLVGKFKFNELKVDLEISETFKLNGIKIKKGAVEDYVSTTLRSYFEEEYNVTFEKNLIFDALTTVSRKDGNRFNPLTCYLSNLKWKWDKKPRMETVFIDYTGVDDTPVNRKITIKILVGAVARAFDHEILFDHVLDLVGDQGTGKTTILRKLSKGWYYVVTKAFDDKDDMISIGNAWFVIDDEMSVSNESKIAVIKKFVTETTLKLRRPYDRRPVEIPKNSILIRTGNYTEHLFDQTGNRRFLPLEAHENQIKKHLDDLSDKDIDQIWAEAYDMYLDLKDSGELQNFLRPSSEEETEFDKHRASFMRKSPEEKRVNMLLDDWDDDFISTEEISLEVFGESHTINKNSNKIAKIMDRKQDWKPVQAGEKYDRKHGYRRLK